MMIRATKTATSEKRRIAANMKERIRVQRMNKAFFELKKVLPKMTTATKMDLLSSAKDYIEYLTELLQNNYGKDINLTVNGHKIRKICGTSVNQEPSYENPLDHETNFKFSVQSPKSAIPLQQEKISSPNLNQDNAGLFLNLSDSQTKLSQEASTNHQIPIPNHVRSKTWIPVPLPQPGPVPQHRVTNGENTLGNSSNIGTSSLESPTPVNISHCNLPDSQKLIQEFNTQVLPPTLLDDLDQFCCELFDMNYTRIPT